MFTKKLQVPRNPMPVGIGLIPIKTKGGRMGLLLVRRKIKPVGGLCLPGGYIDYGESWQQAISREVLEEACIETNPDDFEIFDVKSTHDNTKILIFGVSRIIYPESVLDNFEETNETCAAKIGCDIHMQLCFDLHQDVYENWWCQSGQNSRIHYRYTTME